MYKRIISLIIVFVMLFSLCPLNSFAEDYVSVPRNFWEAQLFYAIKTSQGGPLGLSVISGLLQSVAGGDVCPASSDAVHHTDSIYGCELGHDRQLGYFAKATCKYCAREFRVFSSDLKDAYAHRMDDLATELGSTVVGKDFVRYNFSIASYSLTYPNVWTIDLFSPFPICFYGSTSSSVGQISAYTDSFVVPFIGTAKHIFLNISNKDLPEKWRRKKRSYKRVRSNVMICGTSIEKRPEHISDRTNFGHWEMDLIIGRATDAASLLVLTERLTRYELIYKLPDKKAHSVSRIIDFLHRRNKDFNKLFKSITVDNGPEFRMANRIEFDSKGCRRTHLYFCHPYSSWERGSK